MRKCPPLQGSATDANGSSPPGNRLKPCCRGRLRDQYAPALDSDRHQRFAKRSFERGGNRRDSRRAWAHGGGYKGNGHAPPSARDAIVSLLNILSPTPGETRWTGVPIYGTKIVESDYGDRCNSRYGAVTVTVCVRVRYGGYGDSLLNSPNFPAPLVARRAIAASASWYRQRPSWRPEAWPDGLPEAWRS